MQKRLYLLFTLMMLSFMACQEVINKENVDAPERMVIERPEVVGQLYLGLDSEGNERSCEDLDDMFCSDEFTDSDQYALDCQRGGNVAIQCSCHDWICVDKNELEADNRPKEVSGYNIDGEIESCEPFDYTVDGQQVMCTTEFTLEDQFAIDCQAEGYEAVQCGCHKFICLM